ncbi:unnamed protein product, partial [marine sediment metagenome]
ENFKIHSFSCADKLATKAGWFKRFQAGNTIDKLTVRRILGTRHWQIDFIGNIDIDINIK